MSVANSAVSSPALPRSSTLAGSRAKGMQLGANKTPAATFAMQLEEEMGGGASPWGTDDLIDINADEDDWSMFYPWHPRDFDAHILCRRF